MHLSRESKRRRRGLLPLRAFARHLFIVGAQKAGTAALHAYLKDRPQPACGTEKELSFFPREQVYALGLDYYRSCFPTITANRCALGASPRYVYSRCGAERIYRFAPLRKIVILPRGPVSRAFSALNMYQKPFYQPLAMPAPGLPRIKKR